MVRLVPTRLGRLMTLALQANSRRDGSALVPGGTFSVLRAPPAPIGMPGIGFAALEAEPQRVASPGADARPQDSRYLQEIRGFGRRAGGEHADGDAFLCFLFEAIRATPPGGTLDHLKACKLAGARWAMMAEEQRAPYLKMAGPPAPGPKTAGGEAIVCSADFAAFVRFLYDEVRGAGLGSSRPRAFALAGAKWASMDDVARAHYFEVPAPQGSERASRWRRLFRAARRIQRGTRPDAQPAPPSSVADGDGDAFLCFFYDDIRGAPAQASTDHVQALRLAHAKWAVMADTQKALYRSMAARGATDEAMDLDLPLDDDAELAPFMRFLFDEVRASGLGSSRIRAFTMASAKWSRMDGAAKAPYMEAGGV